MIEPNPQGILYHYCDAHAAQSILTEGKLWLSPFSLSNDSREGLVGQEAIIAAAKSYGASPHMTSQVERHIQMLDRLNSCYGMCFSTHHDKLSQWRGYADNGAGFAIGFKADMLDWLLFPHVQDETPQIHGESIRLQPVQYTADGQHEIASRIFKAMEPDLGKLALTENGFSGPRSTGTEEIDAQVAVGGTLLTAWPEIYTMKGEAFAEESEWRAIATAFSYQKGFRFRVTKGKLVPYIEHCLRPDTNPIREIVLGPRNTTPQYVVEMMLTTADLSNQVKIYPSEASYR